LAAACCICAVCVVNAPVTLRSLSREVELEYVCVFDLAG
jgi:hypothetical protein